jgi:hypothetical protein
MAGHNVGSGYYLPSDREAQQKKTSKTVANPQQRLRHNKIQSGQRLANHWPEWPSRSHSLARLQPGLSAGAQHPESKKPQKGQIFRIFQPPSAKIL